MSFISVLDTIGKDAKKVFSFLGSAKGQAIVAAGESVVESVDPLTSGFFTLANNWLAEILKTQALATAAAASAGADTQKAAIALSTITPQVLAWAQQNGLSTPTADTLATANAALVTFFNAFGVTSANAIPAMTSSVAQVTSGTVQNAATTGSVVAPK